PGSSGGPPSNASYSTLLRTGVAEPRRSPDALVGSYPTVAPLPRASPRAAVSFLLPLREVAPAWLTPASCPVESGLSPTAEAPAAARPAPPAGNATGSGPGRPARCPRRGWRAGRPRRFARARRARRSRGRTPRRGGAPGGAEV